MVGNVRNVNTYRRKKIKLHLSIMKCFPLLSLLFFSGDDVIGKVTFLREDMLSMNPAGGEVWYSLRQVDNASEVHGQLHLKILATNYVSSIA